MRKIVFYIWAVYMLFKLNKKVIRKSPLCSAQSNTLGFPHTVSELGLYQTRVANSHAKDQTEH